MGVSNYFRFDEDMEPRDKKQMIKLVYFGIISLLVFAFTLTILVHVNKNARQTKDVISRLDQLAAEIKANTEGPPPPPTVQPTVPPPPPSTEPPPTFCDNIPENEKFDCHPENGTSEAECGARGCCWKDQGTSFSPIPSTPSCYFPRSYLGGYTEVSRITGEDRVLLTVRRQLPSGFRRDVKDVAVEVIALDNDKVRVRIYDPTKKRFEVPLPPLNLTSNYHQDLKGRKYAIDVEGLNIRISRVSTGTVVVGMDLSTMIFSDQFLQVSNRVPAHFLYGLGEHYDVFR